MGAVLEVPGLGRATRCDAANEHRPTPLRFVWHHILPETCGGATDFVNVVQVCDSCHLGIHALLWLLRTGDGDPGLWGRHGTRMQRELAQRGWDAAVAVGATARIPNEGSIFSH